MSNSICDYDEGDINSRGSEKDLPLALRLHLLAFSPFRSW